MATPAVTNTFVASTPALASEVNENYQDLVDFLTNEVVHIDGTKTMTGDLSLRNADPSSANHAARKSYVDTHDWDNAGEDTDTSTYSNATAVSGTYYTVLSTSVTFTQNETYRIDFFLPQVLTDQNAAVYGDRLLAQLSIDGTEYMVAQGRQYFAATGVSLQGSLRYKHTGTTGAKTVRVKVAHEHGSNAQLDSQATSTNPMRLTICHLGKE